MHTLWLQSDARRSWLSQNRGESLAWMVINTKIYNTISSRVKKTLHCNICDGNIPNVSIFLYKKITKATSKYYIIHLFLQPQSYLCLFNAFDSLCNLKKTKEKYYIRFINRFRLSPLYFIFVLCHFFLVHYR